MQSLIKSDLDQEVLVSILAPLNFFSGELAVLTSVRFHCSQK